MNAIGISQGNMNYNQKKCNQEQKSDLIISVNVVTGVMQ